MIPGAPRNPRQAEMMMRRLGMATEPLEGVEEVVIRTRTKEHYFRSPEVTILTVQGTRTYQVIGPVELRPRSAASAAPGPAGVPAAPEGPPEEDVQLVMDQAHVDRADAIQALRETHGAPAEAILRLLTRSPPGNG
ncbi:MAG: nascent polypeptide-associated complex protein [Thermoplasmata archaeon]|jgi:nascent polypeptide-associated complex subunit alpha